MIRLVNRNLKVFFRDRSAVFFSLLAVFIIIGLYALFLGDVWLGNMPDVEGARSLMDTWVISGLLAVISVTTTLGAFGVMVEDKAKKIAKDFYAAPISRGSITRGYLMSVFIIGCIISLVALVICELYVWLNGGAIMGLEKMVYVLLTIVLTTLSSTAMMCFVVSFFKSINAFSIASTVIGTLIGFVAGIYLPIGVLPDAVQTIIKLFPVSHAASLFRQLLMETPMQTVFAGAPQEAVDEFKGTMGVSFSFGDFEITPLVSIAFLAFTAVLFYVLAKLNMQKKRVV